MDTAVTVMQVVAALGIYNVWLLRFGKATSWRGGSAANMKEEFAAYGLPAGMVGLIGGLKLICATLLIVGIWFPVVTQPAAIALAALMVGAISMHVKVKDPPAKSLPAAIMLVLSLVVAFA
jgi:CHASE2 domain-containing sensor protein